MTKPFRYSDIDKQKFEFLRLSPKWQKHLGEVERASSILVKGYSGHGKTAYCMQMAKEFTKTEKVLYVTAEEGRSSTFRRNLRHNKMHEVQGRIQYIQLKYDGLMKKLRMKRQSKIVFIDSIQYCFGRKQREAYFDMIEEFPSTLFIGISHIDPKGHVKGAVADAFAWDCQNIILVSDWKAHLENWV